MPAVHFESFTVRYHECDAFGHLKRVNCLRWMQESAFAASAAVGYDFARYDEIGQLWLVRETDIEYIAPLRYGDQVTIETWVLDFRRFRSRRAYEFRMAETGRLAVRASTDWVYLNAETLQPVSIPEEMQQAFFPDGVAGESAPHARYPKSPSPPEGQVSLRRRVAWGDIDMMWHANNAQYLDYIEDAERRACAVYGWPIQRMVQEGFCIDTRQHRIKYRRPAELGEELEIVTWCSDVRDTAALRHYEIRRVGDGELLVQARARWGCVDLQTGKPIHISGDFLHALAGNCV